MIFTNISQMDFYHPDNPCYRKTDQLSFFQKKPISIFEGVPKTPIKKKKIVHKFRTFDVDAYINRRSVETIQEKTELPITSIVTPKKNIIIKHENSSNKSDFGKKIGEKINFHEKTVKKSFENEEIFEETFEKKENFQKSFIFQELENIKPLEIPEKKKETKNKNLYILLLILVICLLFLIFRIA